jgi:hypothetical protein
MTLNALSKSNLWRQELFQCRHLPEIAELFLVAVEDESKPKTSFRMDRARFMGSLPLQLNSNGSHG